MNMAATTASNARTPGSFTDTILKWIFILIAVVVIAIIGAIVYFVFFSDVTSIFDGIPFNIFTLVPVVGGVFSLISRL